MTVAAALSPETLADGLRDLRRKYVEMLDMRRDHARGDEDPTAVRARMARLAERFPGCLREIDDLEIAEIERRVADLDRALRGDIEVALWMRALVTFHALARGALSAKRWLEGRKDVSPGSDEERYRLASTTFSFPEDARAWAADLAEVARPPRGRLTDLVFARLALALSVEEKEARALVFGPPKRRPHRR